METELKPPGTIFLSYAQKDEALKEEFEDYLIIMQQSQFIAGWVERQVQRGIDWLQIIDPRVFDANLFLFLLSPSFLASGYSAGAEVREALKRRDAGLARVIPIILHQVGLAKSPFEIIQSLPKGGKPVSLWPNRTEVWGSIDHDLRRVIER